MKPAEAEEVKAFEETMLTKIYEINGGAQDMQNNLFTKAISSDLIVIMNTIMQKKRSLGLVNVDVNLKLQKIDKALKALGGEGLKTKEPFQFQFIKKFESNSKPRREQVDGLLSDNENNKTVKSGENTFARSLSHISHGQSETTTPRANQHN